MGVLDPKVDKERTFELLRKKGAIKAVLEFHGGHDEGWCDSITLTMDGGSEQEFEVWYPDMGYILNEKWAEGGSEPRWVPQTPVANEDEELSDLLQGPIDERFGAWDSVPSTDGTLTWDVEKGSCVIELDQDDAVHRSETVIPSEGTVQVAVTWTETTTYSRTFWLELPEGYDPATAEDLHEQMDEQSAWDQVERQDWVGESLVEVRDRTIDEAKLVVSDE